MKEVGKLLFVTKKNSGFEHFIEAKSASTIDFFLHKLFSFRKKYRKYGYILENMVHFGVLHIENFSTELPPL